MKKILPILIVFIGCSADGDRIDNRTFVYQCVFGAAEIRCTDFEEFASVGEAEATQNANLECTSDGQVTQVCGNTTDIDTAISIGSELLSRFLATGTRIPAVSDEEEASNDSDA